MKKTIESKREKEIATLAFMLGLYCRDKHKVKEGICPSCSKLFAYAKERTLACPRIADKTFCSSCPNKCYSKENQEAIRRVMAYSAPRMLIYRPLSALSYLYDRVKNIIKGK